MEGISFDNGLELTNIDLEIVESTTTAKEHDNSEPTSLTKPGKPCLSKQHSEMSLDISAPGVALTNAGKCRNEKIKCRKRLEVSILCVSIAILMGLLILPIIFYALPATMDGLSATNQTVFDVEAEMCSSTLLYNETICQLELETWTQCIPDGDNNRNVLVQQDVSEEIQALIAALDSPVLGASVECKAAMLPFLCVYFFGLCDSTERAYRPSSSQCIEISTELCATQWPLLKSFGAPLPDCETLPESAIIESCNIEQQDMLMEATFTNDSFHRPNETLITNGTIQCRDEFFYTVENGREICKPKCDSISQFTLPVTKIIDVLTALSNFLGIFFSVAVLVIAGMRWRNMFAFPSVLLIYQAITLLIQKTMIILGYFGREDYLCGSQDLTENLINPTPFCSISGIVAVYTLLQAVIWMLLHILSVFWMIQFPLHANSFKYTKYVHIVFIAIALLAPIVPVIAIIADGHSSGGLGFKLVVYPAYECSGTNLNILYFTIILPINIVLLIILPLLIVTFWNIHKAEKQGSYNIPSGRQSPTFKFGTAEKKILIVFTCYMLLSVVTLTDFTIRARTYISGEYATEFFQYYSCEENGYDPNNPCDKSGLEFLSNPALFALSRILLGISPAFSLIFVIRIQEMKRCLKNMFQFFRRSSLASYPTRSTTTKHG